MKILFAVLISVCALVATSRAAVTHLAPEYRARLSAPEKFQSIDREWLPDSVVKVCADSDGRMAVPGERWEPTDIISDSTLPRKRLIWAAVVQNFYVLHYERGGRGRSYHIVLVEFSSTGNAKIVWRATGERYLDIAAFSKAFAQDRFNDDPKYGF